MNRSWKWIAFAAVVLMAVLFLRRPTDTAPRQGPEVRRALLDRPECPHSWENFFDSTTYEIHGAQPRPIAGNQFSLPGRITDIPEFHDCQRLINHSEPTRYLEFAAVFARENLSEAFARRSDQKNGFIRDSSGRARLESAGATPPYRTDAEIVRTGIAVAEVVSDMDYPPLGIGRGFNCMYLAGKGANWVGVMVSVGIDEKQCEGLVITPGMGVKGLWAKPSGSYPDDVPPVARWDFDAGYNEHVIGIKCDDRWCDVTGRLTGKGGQPAGGSGHPKQQRIKGWYDEQQLAEYDPTTKKVTGPGKPTGTLIPDPDLGTFIREDTFSDPNQTWLPVARVALNSVSPAYLKKYGFVQSASSGQLSAMLKVSLCKGDATRCKIPADATELRKRCVNKTGVTAPLWFAKYEFGSNDTRYYCVVYRGHPGFQIPPVARWRWRVDDETIWIACPQGCCETDAYPGS
jgi:hypothetical protein